MSISRIACAWVGAGALAASVLATPVGAEESTSAVWTQKELHFVYMGFTTHYSCEGLREAVRDVLLQLGARKNDLKVYESGCAGRIGAPDPFPGVTIKMHVLQPPTGTAGETAVPAHWKPVDLLAHRPNSNLGGECELFEQVKQHILPLFTVRNLDYLSNCIPHQLSQGQRLKAEVLVTDEPHPPAGS